MTLVPETQVLALVRRGIINLLRHFLFSESSGCFSRLIMMVVAMILLGKACRSIFIFATSLLVWFLLWLWLFFAGLPLMGLHVPLMIAKTSTKQLRATHHQFLYCAWWRWHGIQKKNTQLIKLEEKNMITKTYRPFPCVYFKIIRQHEFYTLREKAAA